MMKSFLNYLLLGKLIIYLVISLRAFLFYKYLYGVIYMWIEELSNGKFKYFERYTDPYTEKAKRVSITLNSKSNQAKKQAMIELQEKIDLRCNEVSENKITWKEVYDEWWAVYKNTVKSNTIKARMRDKKKLTEVLSDDYLIKKIDSNLLTDILNQLYYKDCLSKSYVEQIRAHINLVLKYAQSRSYILTNPMLEVSIKAKPKTIEQIQKMKNKYLEKDELESVIICARKENERYANLIEFISLTGTRIGEALALKFEDITENNIAIKTTYNYEDNTHETTKNEYSYRDIETTPRILEIIANQKKLYILFQNSDKEFQADQYIFFSNSGQPMSVSAINCFLRTKITPNVSVQGKHLSTHIFRHTHISLLTELGVPLKFIMDRVGHNNPKTTLSIYTHVTNGMRENVKEILDSLIIAP